MATVVTVDQTAVLSTFDARFASVTHDIQDFIGFNIAPWQFEWQDSGLRNLLAPLSPMTVRCGGTWEDGIYWEGGPHTGRFGKTKAGMTAHNLTSSQWHPFATLMDELTGVDLVVGLSALWRRWEGCEDVPASGVCPGKVAWDSRNAEAFIKHNKEAGYNVWGYELGNEPGDRATHA